MVLSLYKGNVPTLSLLMKKGTINELVERGFGYIKMVGCKDKLFFHSDALIDIKFCNLKKGDKVCFTVVESKKGPYAIQVCKV